MVITVGNGHGDPNSNPGWDCISHSANTLRKNYELKTDLNPVIIYLKIGFVLYPAHGSEVG